MGGGPSVLPLDTPTLMGVYIYFDPNLHMVLPTVGAFDVANREAPGWQRGTALVGDASITQVVDCSRWVLGDLNQSWLENEH